MAPVNVSLYENGVWQVYISSYWLNSVTDSL